ncbi:MAG: diguanylate cyclase domain-containing protein [Caldimonas sp.]
MVPPIDEAAPLDHALEQSQIVQAKVEECAEDIGATNDLVKGRIAAGATTISAQKTLSTGLQVEGRVQECANDLQQVTDTLARGIEELKQTETELCSSRRALADTKAALAIAREGEKDARLQALHDSTTGLPNRDLFDTRLEQGISTAKRHGWTLAVLFLDLDRFKSINNTYGHSAGDAVLKEVAHRLRRHARDEDTVCRNGGDEFLYLLVDPRGRSNVERITKKVAARIAEEIAWDGGAPLGVHASIGIALYPDDGDSGESLVRGADAAMYLAKKRGSGHAFAEPVTAKAA